MSISLEFENGSLSRSSYEERVSVLRNGLVDAYCSYEMTMDGIADGIIAVEDVSSSIYRRVHSKVLKYEGVVLKYLFGPPRLYTSLLEAQMGAQLAINGRIDNATLGLWTASKIVSWVPYGCALFPETTARRIVVGAVKHAARLYWHPRNELPILTNRVVRIADETCDKAFKLACLVQAHPGHVARRIVDVSLGYFDRAVEFNDKLLQGIQMVGENLGHDAPREVYINTAPVITERNKIY
ncbi:MAG: hypothetical protein M3Q44_00920 [bacterium]|nr:hypothetical protein [bacterium]